MLICGENASADCIMQATPVLHERCVSGPFVRRKESLKESLKSTRVHKERPNGLMAASRFVVLQAPQHLWHEAHTTETHMRIRAALFVLLPACLSPVSSESIPST